MKRFLVCALVGVALFSVQANATSTISETRSVFVFKGEDEVKAPMIKSVNQVAPNIIEITFNNAVNSKNAINPTNYWIQTIKDEKPSGLATLGKKDKPSKENALTAKMVKITTDDKENKTFTLKFNEDIPSGVKYRLIINNISNEKGTEFKGDNGSKVFEGK